MLSRDTLPVDILTVTVAFCKKLQQKTHHNHQFEKVYGMRTMFTIVKADYCFMSLLLLNILSNVTLPPYPSFFVHFKHTFVAHLIKIFCFSITVTPPPKDTACHPPKILNLHRWRGVNLGRCKKSQNYRFFDIL